MKSQQVSEQSQSFSSINKWSHVQEQKYPVNLNTGTSISHPISNFSLQITTRRSREKAYNGKGRAVVVFLLCFYISLKDSLRLFILHPRTMLLPAPLTLGRGKEQWQKEGMSKCLICLVLSLLLSGFLNALSHADI